MWHEPWIKRGDYGHVVENCTEYVIPYPRWARALMRVVKFVQFRLWKVGIAVHDPIFGECTPDFNCCCETGRKAFVRLGTKVR